MRLLFGDFVLDLDARELRREGRPAHLTTKAFDLLVALAARRPRVLTKAEAQKLLWPDTFVAEANLSNLMAEVRSALGDDARRPLYIRTVHGVGYAFCGEATSAGRVPGGSPLLYRLEWAGGLIALAEGEYLLGRHPESIVPTTAAGVSRRHARLHVGDGQAVLEDLGSRHGTFVDGRRLERAATLASGDSFQLGRLSFTLLVSRPEFSDTRDP